MEIVFDHNLDHMDQAELQALRRKLRRHAAQLDLLADYCVHKHAATETRTKGLVFIAENHEHKCDEIYQQLLPKYQW